MGGDEPLSGHGSRTFEVHYSSWNIDMRVVDPSTSQQLYTLSGNGLGKTLTAINAAGVVVGTGRTSSMSSSVTINLTGANNGGGGGATFETHTGKFWGGNPSYESPAFGGQKMTWKNKMMSTKISYTLIGEDGLALARFESAGMKWKRVGALEIVDAVQGQEKVDEIVVTVLTLLYRKLVAMNTTVVTS